jgi:hypothetical protein
MGKGPKNPWQSPAFLAAREKARGTGRKCDHCNRYALRGALFCKRHGGLLSAAAAEAERYGRPVMIIRKGKRRAMLYRLGLEGPPVEMPLPAWYHDLRSHVQRGILIEAWLNRELNPDEWKKRLGEGLEIRYVSV